LVVIGNSIVAVTAMVTGALPQLKVITPPLVTAVARAENVQLAGVPVPTTLVGVETSASVAPAGSALLHDVGMLVSVTIVPASVGVEPESVGAEPESVDADPESVCDVWVAVAESPAWVVSATTESPVDASGDGE
jgi:hypothetical protein